MKIVLLLILVMLNTLIIQGQAIMDRKLSTDASLFWKDTGQRVDSVATKDGDLYQQLGHHGPAVENLWAGYRIYFNAYGSVDILSKFQARLELKTSKWYGNDSLFTLHYGMDNYRVGKTVGLGGLRLLYDDTAHCLETDVLRTAQVHTDSTGSKITMRTFAVPYQGHSVDISLTLVVVPNQRHATIEAQVLGNQKVRFVTGTVCHSGLEVKERKGYILTWGDHPSPASPLGFEVGSALLYDPSVFREVKKTKEAYLLISEPTQAVRYIITTANEREQSDSFNQRRFYSYVDNLASGLGFLESKVPSQDIEIHKK